MDGRSRSNFLLFLIIIFSFHIAVFPWIFLLRIRHRYSMIMPPMLKMVRGRRGGVQKRQRFNRGAGAAVKRTISTALSAGAGGVGGYLLGKHFVNPARSNRIGYVGNAATKTHR